jgi:hypothetical protein
VREREREREKERKFTDLFFKNYLLELFTFYADVNKSILYESQKKKKK